MNDLSNTLYALHQIKIERDRQRRKRQQKNDVFDGRPKVSDPFGNDPLLEQLKTSGHKKMRTEET